jgi:hypothetical protein
MPGDVFLNDFFNRFATQSSFERFHQKDFSYREKLFSKALAVETAKSLAEPKIKLVNPGKKNKNAA